MNDWDELTTWLEDDRYLPQFENPFYIRLFQAVKEGAQGRDLAALIRGVIRHEAEKNGVDRCILKVPRTQKWPDREIYEKMGMVIFEERDDCYLLYALPWSPQWLPHSKGEEPDRPLFGLIHRSHLKEVSGDPFLTEVGRQSYRCAPQRDAIRTILTSPNNATILINLPTGSGKSLCGQLPALLFSKQEGVTVVVVPTVALALDQERALMPFINHESAYFSSNSRLSENDAIRSRIMNGTQRVVFASPESVMQALDFSLQVAAKKGYFKMLVIDEAHTVDSWGDSFRPAFQELAGWRRMMLRKALEPFRTLLLSATVTESCLDTLETLFAGPGIFDSYSAVTLRPEPAYWQAKCTNQNEKKERLIESIDYLPRPLIVYTTEVKHAIKLFSEIRTEGYNRVRVFHGDTKQNEREAIIEDWHHRRIDIVVATSAFGLGVDQGEVRAVIHACVPESIDRFYQEVGRGGRDGRACMSLMLYDYDDIQLARKMSAPRLISIEKGRPRWERMFTNKRTIPEAPDKFLLPVTISSGIDPDRIDQKNDYNEQWHLRTLTMLSRMGVLEFDWEDIGASEEGEENHWRIVRMLRHDHMGDEFWEEVEQYRKSSKRSDRDEFSLMERLLKSGECISNLLKEIYSIQPSMNQDYLRREVYVAPACGGCPACRLEHRKPGSPALNRYPLQWPPFDTITGLLRRYLDPASHQLVLLRESGNGGKQTIGMSEKLSMLRMVYWFVNQGIKHIVASENILNWLREDVTLSDRYILFTSKMHEYNALTRVKWKIPTLVIHECRTDNEMVYRWLKSENVREYPTIFMIPEDMDHPLRIGQRLSDSLDIRNYRYDAFKQEVGL
ncbi:ATP-dependent DNA helicase RecQ [Brevibacillus fluminis]|uniref:DNA 3'-5' helicase n=1 Tax=Brevibacillus fluminis TaxID=511487 RepID=A0A3M8DYB8_9BACL|nr:protein DpdF [Brevibacillus fluminis]RNB92519.1 ATP-dependent DNA helicase RecQ [Brevibacillus fluminis]